MSTATLASALAQSLVYRHSNEISLDAICVPPWRDWPLAKFYSQEDALANSALRDDLATLLAECGTTTAFAPSVAKMSARIVPSRALSTRIPLGRGVSLFRKKEIPSDGTFLDKGEAFVMSASGCPVVVATGGGFCIATHAARESLIDKDRIACGMPREHESVLAAIAEAFLDLNVSLKDVSVHGYFSIPGYALAHPFEYPGLGEYYRAMAKDVLKRWGHEPLWIENSSGGEVAYLDLSALILTQARAFGFGYAECDGILDANEHPEFGHTRHPDEKLRGARNLVIIHRRR